MYNGRNNDYYKDIKAGDKKGWKTDDFRIEEEEQKQTWGNIQDFQD